MEYVLAALFIVCLPIVMLATWALYEPVKKVNRE